MSQTIERVGEAKNGSSVAVDASGKRVICLSLIAFQPAIEEPSNITPSVKVSSSISATSKVTCCHLPRGSVNLRSTYLMSLSLMVFRTSLAVCISLFLCLVIERGQGQRKRCSARG